MSSCPLVWIFFGGDLLLPRQQWILDIHMVNTAAQEKLHSAKSKTMTLFLNFVDVNSQLNSRAADSTGPIHYFIPKFYTTQSPSEQFQTLKSAILDLCVGEFNWSQRELGKHECSNGSLHNWLKCHHPKVTICPH